MCVPSIAPHTILENPDVFLDYWPMPNVLLQMACTVFNILIAICNQAFDEFSALRQNFFTL